MRMPQSEVARGVEERANRALVDEAFPGATGGVKGGAAVGGVSGGVAGGSTVAMPAALSSRERSIVALIRITGASPTRTISSAPSEASAISSSEAYW